MSKFKITLIYKSLLVISLLGLSACDRAVEETSFSIQLPTVQKLNQSISAQSAMDASLLCFVVDIQGGRIRQKEAQTCDPVKGTMFGSAAPGEIISGSIEEGTYDFKIYALKRTSTSQECPHVDVNSWNWPLSKVYFVGETKAQAVEGPTANVTIKISIPDSTNNLVVSGGFPNTCNSVGVPNNPGTEGGSANSRVLLGAAYSTTASYRLYSKVNFKHAAPTQTSTNFKVLNWKVGPQ